MTPQPLSAQPQPQGQAAKPEARVVWDRFVRGFHWALVLALGLAGWMQSLDAFWGEGWLMDLHEHLAQGLMVLAGLHAAALLMGRIERTRLVKAMVTGVKERY